jgi:DNA-binding NtrC family response regulator
MPQLRLIFQSEGKERPYLLRGSRWTLGRDPRSDIVIPDPLVSRRHAVLWYEGSRLFIRDAGAKNPVEVDGKAAHEAIELELGSVMQFGNTQATLRGPSEAHARFEATDNSQVSDVWVLPHAPTEIDSAELDTLHKVADAMQPVRTLDDAAYLMVRLVESLIEAERIIVARIGSQDRIEILASRKREDPLKIPRQLLSNLRSAHRASSICRRCPGESGRDYQLMMAAPWVRGDRVDGFLFVQRSLKPAEIESMLSVDDTVASSESVHCTEADSELQMIQVLTRFFDARIGAIETLEHLETERISMQSYTQKLPTFLSVSPETQELRRRLERLSPLRDPIAIIGEEGSGKRFLSLHIHGGSFETRRDGDVVPPFITARLSAEAPERGEDELFGIGKSENELSLLHKAHGGTLCIKHIELLSQTAQERLVDELQHGRIRTNGESVPLEVRLIVTSRARREEFPAYLHPALRELLPHEPVETVPLCKRLDDIPLLSSYFLEDYARRTSTTAARISPRAMDRLRAYSWPQNVRELSQVLETAAVLARGHVIYPKQLPPQFTQARNRASAVPSEIPTLKEIEAEHIRRVLELVGGNKSLACKALGIAYSTLHEKLKLIT